MEYETITYSLVIEWHDNRFLAFFPSLPGCHIWSRNLEDALSKAPEAIAAYLERLLAQGGPLPEDKVTAPISLSVTVRNVVIR